MQVHFSRGQNKEKSIPWLRAKIDKIGLQSGVTVWPIIFFIKSTLDIKPNRKSMKTKFIHQYRFRDQEKRNFSYIVLVYGSIVFTIKI